MNCKITRPVSGGTVKAIPSKSAAHRLLIAAGLSCLCIEGKAEWLSADITATKNCIAQLMSDKDTKVMDCGESGSTLRFMVPLAAAFGGRSEFHVAGRLSERPMGPLKEQLERHGCRMSSQGESPVWVEGKLESGKYVLPGNISSQYVSGLLMALPLCEGSSQIVVNGPLQSRPYVDMTLDVLAKAGIQFFADADSEDDSTIFTVPGGQAYSLPEACLDEIEGDWSNAAFWLAMDAISPAHIGCVGLDENSLQGDRIILDWLRIVDGDAADTSCGSGSCGGASCGSDVEIDVSDTPDLVPVLSVLASARKKGAVTKLVNAGRLRFKESDRLKSVAKAMNVLGANIEEHSDSLIIHGVERLKGGTISSYNDHRIVMMAAAAACIADSPVEIIGAEAVNKSYPAFFDDYISLGGEVTWL